jgi:alkylation response protein AidB-like acyl-CoA dehydrogenase
MTSEALIERLRSLAEVTMPLPGAGDTPCRHRRLMEVGREDLSLARLAEAHWDAVSILAEAGLKPEPGAIYGVWASEKPGQDLSLIPRGDRYSLVGTKMFCSGAGLVDRALVTVSPPERFLVDVDLRREMEGFEFNTSGWKSSAFQQTGTATAIFKKISILPDEVIGEAGWYLSRPGFWHGACGPAACWAGGAAGLVDYAMQQSRDDPHTLAHLGAMHASIWGLRCYLDMAGREIDARPYNIGEAHSRALTVRHLVEQACTEVLRRLPRAYGPHPLAFDEEISRRYQELDLYLRQSHAERDLESSGRELKSQQIRSNEQVSSPVF